MGAAGAKWDEGKHFRGYHGRFAAGRDRSEGRATGGNNVFRPPTAAAEQRARKEHLPAKVRETRAVYGKRDRGERLTPQEKNKISWASPKKISEQVAKTGDAYVPRSEALARERSHASGARTGYRSARSGIKKTFGGKTRVERGNSREILTPTPGKPGTFDVSHEDRVRRSFDWPATGKHKTARSLMSDGPKPASAPKPSIPAYDAATSDARLKEIAKSLGVTLPPRAGRNQVIKLIEGLR